ncbi:MAG: helix-turn-helix transcriptional regulator [Alistipes sp.]|nr:helix-turn-helix transcriptional regulator [Alistipes sp.]MDY5200263.1 helix-turn-helix transcriptional regulator [Candidatus Cryptobacteroides sp.]
METTELIQLGQVIREKREAKNLTQIQVAEKAQLDRNYIGMVERGERNPSYLSLIKIANGLDMQVFQLIKPL